MAYQKFIEECINNQTSCLLASINQAGIPQIRAMLMPVKAEGNTFWFHTNTSSKKVQQYKDNAKACLYFYDDATYQGVSLLGTVEVLDKDVDKKNFWKDEYKVYYSNGEGLSDFTVLKFVASEGSYYHNFSSQEFSL